MGESGTGKSTLGNILLGKNIFEVSNEFINENSKVSFSIGLFMGKTSPICVIDTPGLTGEEEKDLEKIQDVIESIKNFKKIKAFLLIMDGTAKRWNKNIFSILKLINENFPNFWVNTIIVFNFWSCDSYSKSIRKITGTDEQLVSYNIKRMICKNLGYGDDINKNIKVNFLNTIRYKNMEFGNRENVLLKHELFKTIENIQTQWTQFSDYDTTSLKFIPLENNNNLKELDLSYNLIEILETNTFNNNYNNLNNTMFNQNTRRKTN